MEVWEVVWLCSPWDVVGAGPLGYHLWQLAGIAEGSARNPAPFAQGLPQPFSPGVSPAVKPQGEQPCLPLLSWEVDIPVPLGLCAANTVTWPALAVVEQVHSQILV